VAVDPESASLATVGGMGSPVLEVNVGIALGASEGKLEGVVLGASEGISLGTSLGETLDKASEAGIVFTVGAAVGSVARGLKSSFGGKLSRSTSVEGLTDTGATDEVGVAVETFCGVGVDPESASLATVGGMGSPVLEVNVGIALGASEGKLEGVVLGASEGISLGTSLGETLDKASEAGIVFTVGAAVGSVAGGLKSSFGGKLSRSTSVVGLTDTGATDEVGVAVETISGVGVDPESASLATVGGMGSPVLEVNVGIALGASEGKLEGVVLGASEGISLGTSLGETLDKASEAGIVFTVGAAVGSVARGLKSSFGGKLSRSTSVEGLTDTGATDEVGVAVETISGVGVDPESASLATVGGMGSPVLEVNVGIALGASEGKLEGVVLGASEGISLGTSLGETLDKASEAGIVFTVGAAVGSVARGLKSSFGGKLSRSTSVEGLTDTGATDEVGVAVETISGVGVDPESASLATVGGMGSPVLEVNVGIALGASEGKLEGVVLGASEGISLGTSLGETLDKASEAGIVFTVGAAVGSVARGLKSSFGGKLSRSTSVEGLTDTGATDEVGVAVETISGVGVDPESASLATVGGMGSPVLEVNVGIALGASEGKLEGVVLGASEGISLGTSLGETLDKASEAGIVFTVGAAVGSVAGGLKSSFGGKLSRSTSVEGLTDTGATDEVGVVVETISGVGVDPESASLATVGGMGSPVLEVNVGIALGASEGKLEGVVLGASEGISLGTSLGETLDKASEAGIVFTVGAAVGSVARGLKSSFGGKLSRSTSVVGLTDTGATDEVGVAVETTSGVAVDPESASLATVEGMGSPVLEVNVGIALGASEGKLEGVVLGASEGISLGTSLGETLDKTSEAGIVFTVGAAVGSVAGGLKSSFGGKLSRSTSVEGLTDTGATDEVGVAVETISGVDVDPESASLATVGGMGSPVLEVNVGIALGASEGKLEGVVLGASEGISLGTSLGETLDKASEAGIVFTVGAAVGSVAGGLKSSFGGKLSRSTSVEGLTDTGATDEVGVAVETISGVGVDPETASLATVGGMGSPVLEVNVGIALGASGGSLFGLESSPS
jgi:hypothetical protein